MSLANDIGLSSPVYFKTHNDGYYRYNNIITSFPVTLPRPFIFESVHNVIFFVIIKPRPPAFRTMMDNLIQQP